MTEFRIGGPHGERMYGWGKRMGKEQMLREALESIAEELEGIAEEGERGLWAGRLIRRAWDAILNPHDNETRASDHPKYVREVERGGLRSATRTDSEPATTLERLRELGSRRFGISYEEWADSVLERQQGVSNPLLEERRERNEGMGNGSESKTEEMHLLERPDLFATVEDERASGDEPSSHVSVRVASLVDGVRDWARMRVGGDGYISLTEHQARQLGEKLLAIADYIVQQEKIRNTPEPKFNAGDVIEITTNKFESAPLGTRYIVAESEQYLLRGDACTVTMTNGLRVDSGWLKVVLKASE